MDVLERYVTDCENKRRRMRDRPSDAVVSELRMLLDSLKPDRDERGPSEDRRRDLEDRERRSVS